MHDCEVTMTDMNDLRDVYRERIQDARKLALELVDDIKRLEARAKFLEEAIFHIEDY